MGRGQGGKIKNWKSKGRYSWVYQGDKDARVTVVDEGRGYRGKLFGDDVRISSITPRKSRKEDARKMTSNWLRNHTEI